MTYGPGVWRTERPGTPRHRRPTLRPADPGCGSVDDEDLAGSRLDRVVDIPGPAPVCDEHEQRAPVGPPEHGREARPVELDPLEPLAPLADARAVVRHGAGGRPDTTVGVEADAVRANRLCPCPAVREAAVGREGELREAMGERPRARQG